jgi:hypothetical protein
VGGRAPGERPVRRHHDDPEFGYRFLADEAREEGQAMADRTAWRICSANGWWSVFGKPPGRNGKKKRKAGTPALEVDAVALHGAVPAGGDPRDVGHEPVWCGAVPVLFAGFDVNDVTGSDFDDRAATVGDQPDAVGDVQRLSLGVGVPGGPGAGGEADVSAADRGLDVRVLMVSM